jgi:hypothetical protein
MRKWLEGMNIFLLVVVGLLYVAAKIHFFTRFRSLSTSQYLEEHWPFWAGMAIIGGVGAFLERVANRLERRKSKAPDEERDARRKP